MSIQFINSTTYISFGSYMNTKIMHEAISMAAPTEHLSMWLTLKLRGGSGAADQSVRKLPLTHTGGGASTIAFEILRKCKKKATHWGGILFYNIYIYIYSSMKESEIQQEVILGEDWPSKQQAGKHVRSTTEANSETKPEQSNKTVGTEPEIQSEKCRKVGTNVGEWKNESEKS